MKTAILILVVVIPIVLVFGTAVIIVCSPSWWILLALFDTAFFSFVALNILDGTFKL